MEIKSGHYGYYIWTGTQYMWPNGTLNNVAYDSNGSMIGFYRDYECAHKILKKYTKLTTKDLKTGQQFRISIDKEAGVFTKLNCTWLNDNIYILNDTSNIYHDPDGSLEVELC